MKHKQSTTFEERINDVFLRYGRIPFLIILAMTVLIIVGVFGYTNIYLVNHTQNKIQTMNQSVLKATERVMDRVEEVDFADLKKYPTNNSRTLYQFYYELNRYVDNHGQIIVFDEERVLFITQPSLEGNDYNHLYNRYIIQQLNESSTFITTMFDIANENASFVVYGRRLVDEAGNALNVLVYINTQHFQNTLYQQRPNHVVVSDRFDNVIASTSSDFTTTLNKFNPSQAKTLSLDHAKYVIYTKSIFDGQIKLSVLIQNQDLYIMMSFLIVIASLALFLMQRINRLSARKVGKEVSHSVAILQEGVKQLEAGDLEARVELHTNDEFESLGNAFNAMSSQLSLLMQTNERLIELRKNAEIKQLEAQFNPHFLYNSLETVRYLIQDDPKTAEHLILNTSRLLRYSIEPSDNEVPFRDDMAYIELYMMINKMRLGDRFDYTLDIQEEVLNMNLPKLIIQPLIENCLKHGYRSKDTLNVGVVGYQKHGYVYIHVIDDGDGMSPKLVETFNRYDYDTLNQETRFGVMSVIQRISLIYGNKGSVHIESDSGGTHITICIPEGGVQIV